MKIYEQIKWLTRNSYKLAYFVFIAQIIIMILQILFNNPFLILALLGSPELLIFIIHIIVIVLEFVSFIGIIWYLISILVYKRRNQWFKMLIVFAILNSLIIGGIFIADFYYFILNPHEVILYSLTIAGAINLIMLFVSLRKLHINDNIFL